MERYRVRMETLPTSNKTSSLLHSGVPSFTSLLGPNFQLHSIVSPQWQETHKSQHLSFACWKLKICWKVKWKAFLAFLYVFILDHYWGSVTPITLWVYCCITQINWIISYQACPEGENKILLIWVDWGPSLREINDKSREKKTQVDIRDLMSFWST